MEITHLGHACVLVETGGARLLIDPGTMSSFTGIRDLDAVLVTHQHPDHIDLSRLMPLLEHNPGCRLVVDPDTAAALPVQHADPVVARPGDRLRFGGCSVAARGGIHAAVYADVPGCTNTAYLIDDGALLHPGDSFDVPGQDVDVLLVPIDGPWLKLAEAVQYVHTIAPRMAVAIHEGETLDPSKYVRMLSTFAPATLIDGPLIGNPIRV